jgi:hypothetical protein
MGKAKALFAQLGYFPTWVDHDSLYERFKITITQEVT